MVPAMLPRSQDEAQIQRPPQRQKGRQGIQRKALLQEEERQKKGRSNLADDQTDAWQPDGQWEDSQWQDQYWDDWSWYESEESYAAKGKGKKGKKGKGKGKCGKDGKDGKSGKDGQAELAVSPQSSTTAAATFFVEHVNPLNFSFVATENKIDKIEQAFISQHLTPTAMVLDLGCTRAMASRVAVQDLMKFCDHNPNCGIRYTIAETASQFTFANSESTKCNQKLIVCRYDREYAVRSTEFDIVEQGHVPIHVLATDAQPEVPV